MTEPDNDRLLDHNYDGIQEYDNPMPRWWLYIFWATIVFSAVYLADTGGRLRGPSRIEAYERDMAAFQAQQPKPGGGDVTEASLATLVADTAALSLGKKTFTETCAPCHRADGGGLIGPNLTDDYWIHGGTGMDIWKTVTEGVLAKGMPAWGRLLKPDQLLAVVAYVSTLRGTKPPDPKAPEGPRADSAAGGAPAGAKP
jgi:cytochrome c oxidase cbb3-type subunit 3